jgi:ketosteroid isomerase-like protein
MMRTCLLAIVFLLVGSPARAQGIDSPAEVAVRLADSAWAEAAASNDVDRMLSFYDPDAVFLGTSPTTHGLDGLRALWDRFFSMPGYKLTWKLEGVAVAASGDIAYSFGPWQETRMRDGELRTGSGYYLAVWKKQPDGTWKVVADKP